MGPLPDPQEIDPSLIADSIVAAVAKKQTPTEVYDLAFKKILKYGEGEFQRGQQYERSVASTLSKLVVPPDKQTPPPLPETKPDGYTIPASMLNLSP